MSFCDFEHSFLLGKYAGMRLLCCKAYHMHVCVCVCTLCICVIETLYRYTHTIRCICKYTRTRTCHAVYQITLPAAMCDSFRGSTFLSTLGIVSPSNLSYGVILVIGRGQ